MDILHTFGFDYKLFLGQAVNFLILVYVFKRFLYKPILGVLKERENRIKQGLEDSEKARLTLESSNREGAGILKAARQEAQEVIDNARKVALDMRQQIVEDSRAESEKILAQAKAQAQAEAEKTEKQLQALSLDLSRKILSNVIETLFTREEKERILKKAVQQLGKETPPAGNA